MGAKNVSLTPEADGAVEVGLMFPHSRGIEGHGKLHTGWSPEPHGVTETVVDSWLDSKMGPETVSGQRQSQPVHRQSALANLGQPLACFVRDCQM